MHAFTVVLTALLGLPQSHATSAAASGTAAAAVVVLAQNATMGEQFAAAEMAWLGGNISNGNVPLPIHNLSASGDPPTGGTSLLIAVGHGAALALGVPAAQLRNLGLDGLRICVPSANNSLPANAVALSGSLTAPRGTMYAVYEFLESNGLEMLAWDETLVLDDLHKYRASYCVRCT